MEEKGEGDVIMWGDRLSKDGTVLDLSYTNLTSLDGIVLPSRLLELNLRATNLTSLEGIRLPAGLRELNLNATNLTSLNGVKLPASLRNLRLSGTYLTSLSGIELPANLQVLDLSVTNLESLNGIRIPKCLQELDLRSTNLTSLKDVMLPPGLQRLDLRGTKLVNLGDIKLPEGLQVLSLSGMEPAAGFLRLSLFVTELTSLGGVELPESLRVLDLSGTKLNSLDAVTLPGNLQRLNLSNTKLTILPESVRQLKHLEDIVLAGLELEELPNWLSEFGLPFTREMYTSGICLRETTVRDIDMSIFDQSQEAILQWFEERKKQDMTPLNEIKVVFLGNGDVGKSHTIARLLRDGETPDASFTGESTPGIAISDKTYNVNGRDIRVHFWDFGGQHILFSMHRMFLTERTIYVVLVDARSEGRSAQAREWLETIKSFAGEANVLLAVNKLDQNPGADLDEPMLMAAYPNLKKVIYLSALIDGKEAFNENFTDAMLELICQSNVPKMKWPRNWKRVKDALQNMEEPYIFSRDYERICRECGVEEGGENLLNWCNDLGVCFRREDKRLRDYVILRPEWITNAIYTIIFNKRESVRNGLISLEDVFDLLTADESRRVRGDITYSWQDMSYVLDVVRKFSLSYPVNQDLEFFPMLCSEKTDSVVQEYAEKNDTLEFHMEFEYLPNNVIHRLMVERHSELDPDKVWLTGVRFRQRDTRLSAVVKIDGNRLKLYVRSGNPIHSPNTYLSVIVGSVERICFDLKLPKTRNWLIYKAGGKQHAFDYEELLMMLEDGEETAYAFSLDRVNRKPRIMDILNQVAPAETAEQERLLADIVKVCADIQATKLYWGTKEDVRNSFLGMILKYLPYIVLDQTRRGISESGDSDGELDLDIRKYKDIPWTICEALRVVGVNKGKWNDHLDKLLVNYNPNGLRFLILLTYVDDVRDRYDAIWKGFKEHIRGYAPGSFRVVPNSFHHYTHGAWTGNHYIQTARCEYAYGDYQPTVYHIFVRMGR